MASGIQPDATKKNAPAAPTPKPVAAANPVKPPAAAKPAAVPPKQPPAEPEDDADDDDGPRRSVGSAILKTAPGWAVSMLLHIIILLLMALIVQAPPKEEQARVITSTPGEADEDFSEFEAELPQDQPDAPQQENAAEAVVTEAAAVTNVEVVTDASVVDASSVAVEFNDFSTETAASSDLLSSVSSATGKGGELSGRGDGQRGKLVGRRGGSKQSEEAVDAALGWFAAHQLRDGSWTLDLKKCPTCNGQCKSEASGAAKYRVAGPTALAILPFLGRGNTHLKGPYQPTVGAGLAALGKRVLSGNGYAGEGNYAQAMTAICLCEAYALTRDEQLRNPAQAAVNAVTAGQDPIGGGWGHDPLLPGTTSVTSWCLVALASAKNAGLATNPQSRKDASQFLDSVQIREGAEYGYMTPTKAEEQFTASGLLCRMYLGWPKDTPALQQGLTILMKKGPSDNLFYNYFGTQVMQNMEGDYWLNWNNQMRDKLVKSQQKDGHAKGSWWEGFETNPKSEAKVGGRIYITSFATLILEAYYRNMPLYSQDAAAGNVFKE